MVIKKMNQNILANYIKSDEYLKLRKEIVLFINKVFQENKDYFTYTSRSIKFLSNLSPITKEYYFQESDIFSKHFNLDITKITNFHLIDDLIRINADYSKSSKDNTNFNVSELFEENLYIRLIRSSHNGSKGHSIFYPVLNFMLDNNFNTIIPINLRLTGEEFTIKDFHYFKILENTGGGVHRLTGIACSLGLLHDCFIKMDFVNKVNYFTKTVIDNCREFIKKINLISEIESVEYSYTNFTINMSNKKCTIRFNKVKEILDFVLHDYFIQYIQQIHKMHFMEITFDNRQLKVFVDNKTKIECTLSPSEKIVEQYYCGIIEFIGSYNKYFELLSNSLITKIKSLLLSPKNIKSIESLGVYIAIVSHK